MPERRRSPSRRTEKLWQKRLPGGTSGDVEAYTTSVHEDLRFGVDDVIASLAHARTLRGAGIISARQLRELERGLKTVRDELRRGNFILARGDEDIHSAVERRLYELCGEVAGTLHSGRSRNDKVATDLRLWARRAAADLVGGISELQEALLARAHEHRTTVLPGYTHGQRAQVVSLAHQLLAYVEMLQRDSARLVDARGRASASPLGSGALAGSTLPLDRQASRAELGLATVSANSMDAVSDRDFLVELSFACALLMTHISRMCEDMILWCSAEYGFAELDDSDATGSSLM
ncbi:MAG TPA: argininosuccinate lyase, partial [Candidatus Dormibacteraeota bacterium]|nr:argininosuccinate lyase [Candidatus Dormibacteraeota bacterium]